MKSFSFKPRPLHVALATSVVVTLALWMYARDRQQRIEDVYAVPEHSPASQAAKDPAIAKTPQAQAFRERAAFEKAMRDYLRDGRSLRLVERTDRARALAAEIARRERARELSAGEAMLLKVGLIRVTIEDEAEQLRQIQALTDRYHADAARREAAWRAQQANDRRFQDYKAEESRIVAEVMAMRTIPDGLSRDEYLRRRLEAARIAAYQGR